MVADQVTAGGPNHDGAAKFTDHLRANVSGRFRKSDAVAVVAVQPTVGVIPAGLKCAPDRAKDEDQHGQREHGGDQVSSTCPPTSFGESFSAMLPGRR